MIRLRNIQSRIRALFLKRPLDTEMDEEMRAHIELRTLANIEAGTNPGEARLAALRGFGGCESIKESCRDLRGMQWVENAARDFRLGIRTLCKKPGFTVVAVATLAVGIGTCTAMFSIINAVILKPLPFRQSDRLVWIENLFPESGLSGRTSRVDTFLGWRAQNKSFESLAAYFAFSDYNHLTMTGSGDPERLTSVAVSDNFLPTLGVPLLHGRNFTAEECAFNGPATVILSYAYWQGRFAGDPGIVGKSVTLNNAPYAVIGVLPSSFDFASVFTPGSRVDVMTAFPLCPQTAAFGNTVFGIGRLRPGVTPEKAQADLALVSDRLRDTIKAGPFGAIVRPLDTALRGRFRAAFLILTGAVVCVLAIACVNLSVLLLARLNSRRQEFAMQIALGANRRHLIQQILAESLLLAFAGSLIGIPLAWWATALLARMQTFGIPLLNNASVDPTALAVTIGLTTLSGLACGLVPALQLFHSRSAGSMENATHQRSACRSSTSARTSLVVAEVALACMLLVGATLLIRSFNAVLRVNLGFQPQHAIAWRIDPTKQFKSGADVDAYFKGLAGQISALPGVEVVGFSDTLPLSRNRSWGAGAVGVQYPPGQFPDAYPRLVDPGYLKAMKIPLISGRLFEENFNSNAEKSIVINETMARQLWPNASALGQKVTVNGESTVIGVVANVRHSSLEEAGGSEMYIDCRQCGDWSTMEMVVRGSAPPEFLIPAVRAALAVYDPGMPRGSFKSLEHLIDDSVGPRSLITRLLGFFSALAVTLAAIGLYGVIAYTVSQRTREIGIRMAVGAQRSNVLWLVLRQGMAPACARIAIGLIASLAVARLMRSLLFGVEAMDPMTFAVGCFLMAFIALAASFLPRSGPRGSNRSPRCEPNENEVRPMIFLKKLRSRFRALFDKRKLDGEMDEEMRSHVEMRTRANIATGMKPEGARLAAVRQFGWRESIKEECREQRGVGWIDNTVRDIRFGARQLRKNPGFTTVAVLTLALGIGANTAMYSFVNAILLRPLPFKDPASLVMVFASYLPVDSHKNWVAAPTLGEWRKRSTSFEGLAARGFGGFVVTGKGQPEGIPGARFSANIFRLLGIQPMLGRDFLPEEETYGNNHVVLLGYELWKRRYGGDTGIIGESITLNDELYTVIGVMPPRTFFPERDTQLWTPLVFGPEQLRDYGSHNFLIYGRIKPGVTLANANREMSLIASRIAESDEHYKGSGAEVYSLHEMTVGDSRTALLVLLASVGLVLVIGCVNIASLLLARSTSRSREFAIRRALGSGRIQLIRQLLTESALLAVLGGIGGIVIGVVGLRALVRFSPPDLPRVWEGIDLDMRTLGFTCAITVTAGLIFGLAPAMNSSVSAPAAELSEGSRGSSVGRRSQRLRAFLVVSEVALSMMLLLGAGLMIRSFSFLVSQDLGYNPERVISMDLGLPSKKYSTLGAQARFFEQLKAKVDNLPGVEAAALVRGLPLSGQNAAGDIAIKGAPPPPPGQSWDADFAQASPGYFRAMTIPIIRGRDFDERDSANSPPVAIVNETFVKNFKLGANALGRLVSCGGVNDIEIIGVVKDSKRSGLANDQRPELYRPYGQQCWGFMSLIVRTESDPALVTREIRFDLDTLDKDQPLENVRTMTQLVARSVTQRRLAVQMLGGFAGLAILLAAIGLYGVLAYNVAQRRREIGVRMALGAQRRNVLSLVIGQGMKLALTGIAIGALSALGLTRAMRSLLYQIEPSDPVTFVIVALLLTIVGLLACWLPARRATRINPMEALRYE